MKTAVININNAYRTYTLRPIQGRAIDYGLTNDIDISIMIHTKKDRGFSRRASLYLRDLPTSCEQTAMLVGGSSWKTSIHSINCYSLFSTGWLFSTVGRSRAKLSNHQVMKQATLESYNFLI